jgi:hypothetical protein
MVTPRFSRFLTLAREHTNLLVALCAEPDVLSRAQLLHYLESHAVPAAQKDALIEELAQAAILLVEHEQGFTVNAAVVDLVNYYERRGRLISATFLRDQMIAIAERTDHLQRAIFATESDQTAILDILDDLYRLVREVREAGLDHYVACMRLLGDIKRTAGQRPLEQRLQDLETAQRRYVEPLRMLIDPSGEYVPRISQLTRLVAELGRQDTLVTQSQELERLRRRMVSDLHFIDHELLRGFAAIIDTARTLLRSLMEEKSIKDALAFCLARLDILWQSLGETTVVSAGRNTIHAATIDRMEAFFVDIVHGRLLPHPRTLTIRPPERRAADDLVLTDRHIWQAIATAQMIHSWPTFVVQTFPSYTENEQLRAIVLPLLRPHPNIAVDPTKRLFVYTLAAQTLQLRDFGVTWKETYAS